MTLRPFSLTITKYMTIGLCLITLLLATPWGTRLTVALLNNINGLAIEYHSGSLAKKLELTSFHLQFNRMDISIYDLSAELDFFCSWQGVLCLKTLEANKLSLNYLTDKEDTTQENRVRQPLFEMPFAITVNNLKLQKTHLVIDKTEVAIEQFATQLEVTKSQFDFLHTSAKQLTVLLDEKKQRRPLSIQQAKKLLASTFIQLPEISLPLALTLQQMHINKISVVTRYDQVTNCQKPCTKKRHQQWLSSNNHLSGSWVHNEISIRQLETTTATFSITEFIAHAKLQPPYSISTQFVSQFHNVLWWPEISDSRQQVSLQGSAEDLNFEVISNGNLALISQGKINLIDINMPFNITMAAKKIPTSIFLLPYGNPSAFFLTGSGDLKQQTIELTSQLNSYGYQDAQVKLVASHQEGLVSINDLIFNDSDSKSQLNLQGQVKFLPKQVAWQLSAKSSGFSLPKMNLQEFSTLWQNKAQLALIASNLSTTITGRLQGVINSAGTWSQSEWSISMSDTDIFGMVNDSALKIEGDISLNQAGRLQPSKLLVTFDDNELTLHSTKNSFWNINGQLSVNNINKWAEGLGGSLISDFSIIGTKNNPIINLNSEFTELSWGDWLSNSLKIETSYQPMNGHQIQLSINNDQLKWESDNGAINTNNFVFNLNGNANKHKIQAHWLGDIIGQTSLEGQLDQAFTQWQGSVGHSALTYQNTRLRNDKSFSFNVDLIKKQSAIAAHCWQGTKISICLTDQALIGDSGNVTAKLDLDLSVIDDLLLLKGVELVSQVTANINAAWSSSQALKAKASFVLSPGYLKITDDLNEHKLSPWSQGELAVEVNEHLLTSKLQLIDTNDQTLMDIVSTLSLINDYPIDTQIVLNQFNLQPLQQVLPDVVNLQGNLTANLVVTGTLQSPSVNGGLTLNNGTLQLSQNANTFDRIHTRITIQNNKATMQGNFYIEDKKARLIGSMAWEDSLTMNLNLNAESLPLIFPPQWVMNISPDVNLHLKDRTLTISGNIDIIDGNFNIEKFPINSVPLSDDVIIVNHEGKTVFKTSSGVAIKTEIRVNIAKAFKISGQGLQSRLFGQLQFSQKEKHPLQLFGRIQSNDGTYQAYGQKLQIEKGELTFNGPINNPYLNLRAGRHIKAKDIDVGIHIKGLTSALNMELFSSPTMEMPEMLSYLVRGQALDAGAGNSSEVASLLVGFGVTNSMGLFDQLEKIPLISNIAVDTEGQGDQTQATVSGYVGNRVYLKYGVGVYEPINELTVRMYLFNRFWLEIVSGIEQSTDLYYSFDID